MWPCGGECTKCGSESRKHLSVQKADRGLWLSQAVSNSLWSYAKLGYNPGILLLDVAAQKAAGMLHQYTSQELANTVHLGRTHSSVIACLGPWLCAMFGIQ